MKHRYDRRKIMRRAHALRAGTVKDFSACLRMAWDEAKAKPIAIAPQRLPLEAAALGVIALAKKIKNSRVEVAFRVKADIGVRVTPRGEAPMAFVKAGEIGAAYERRPN